MRMNRSPPATFGQSALSNGQTAISKGQPALPNNSVLNGITTDQSFPRRRDAS